MLCVLCLHHHDPFISRAPFKGMLNGWEGEAKKSKSHKFKRCHRKWLHTHTRSLSVQQRTFCLLWWKYFLVASSCWVKITLCECWDERERKRTLTLFELTSSFNRCFCRHAGTSKSAIRCNTCSDINFQVEREVKVVSKGRASRGCHRNAKLLHLFSRSLHPVLIIYSDVAQRSSTLRYLRASDLGERGKCLQI